MTEQQKEWWEEGGWIELDEVNLIAACLDGRSLGAFSCTCQAVASHLKSPDILRWLTGLRGLSPSVGISTLEHIELAEAMAQCASNIYFGWGSMTVASSARPSLRKVAQLLERHKSLTLSIEAHCGLEARFAMPLPGQARSFTRDRADAVRNTLLHEARV